MFLHAEKRQIKLVKHSTYFTTICLLSSWQIWTLFWLKEEARKVTETEERHATVMRELVNRYLMHRQMNNDGQGVTEDDLNEIKGDISAFRYEILEIFRGNGFKLNSQDNMKKGRQIVFFLKLFLIFQSIKKFT